MNIYEYKKQLEEVTHITGAEAERLIEIEKAIALHEIARTLSVIATGLEAIEGDLRYIGDSLRQK